jgi:hypothetical protein
MTFSVNEMQLTSRNQVMAVNRYIWSEEVI